MPNTIADNLQRLIDAKDDIADAITAKGGTVASGDGFEAFPFDIVGIPNSYTAGDEGKVVSNGALVAQSSNTVTENGTVDTTLISSLLVNVSGGGYFSKLPIHTGYEQYDNGCNVYLVYGDGDPFMYIIGTLYTSGYNKITFDIPEDFDVNMIGTFVCGRIMYDSGSGIDNFNPTIDIINRTIIISGSPAHRTAIAKYQVNQS